MMTVELFCGDCLDVLLTLEADSIDTVITDPPYGLEFMGKDWDHGVPGKRFWREILRVCKPGAMLLAFGGTRTHHRLMCAIEDAGWEIRDCLMWLYGSGFNKVGLWQNDKVFKRLGIADEWIGWGGSLKPAWEPIIVAMKPRDGTFAHNAQTWGAAGLWIDGGRIPTNGETWAGNQENAHSNYSGAVFGQFGQQYAKPVHPQGRWPANLILSHTEDCRRVGKRRVKGANGQRGACYKIGKYQDGVGNWGTRNTGEKVGYADPDGYETVDKWECSPDCPVRLLDEQSVPQMHNAGHAREKQLQDSPKRPGWGNIGTGPASFRLGDTGGASRFFYCAKVSSSERHAGCDHLFWRKENKHFVQIIEGEWESLPSKKRARGNIHPTIKPLALMRYLVKLTRTPTGGVVLDPFMGSGTTGIACVLEGRGFVGIDQDKDSFEIAKRRIEHAQNQERQLELEVSYA